MTDTDDLAVGEHLDEPLEKPAKKQAAALRTLAASDRRGSL